MPSEISGPNCKLVGMMVSCRRAYSRCDCSDNPCGLVMVAAVINFICLVGAWYNLVLAGRITNS